MTLCLIIWYHIGLHGSVSSSDFNAKTSAEIDQPDLLLPSERSDYHNQNNDHNNTYSYTDDDVYFDTLSDSQSDIIDDAQETVEKLTDENLGFEIGLWASSFGISFAAPTFNIDFFFILRL